VTESTSAGAADAPDSSDWEYDLAHEGADAALSRTQAGPDVRDQVRVVTLTSDPDRDYSYDLAHEVPPETGI
jgi:hypothetical protein